MERENDELAALAEAGAGDPFVEGLLAKARAPRPECFTSEAVAERAASTAARLEASRAAEQAFRDRRGR